MELAGVRKDGSEFLWSFLLAAWRQARMCFYTGIIRDISKRKAAEEALLKECDELEYRVQERTAELAKITEQLQMELAQRKRNGGGAASCAKILQKRRPLSRKSTRRFPSTFTLRRMTSSPS